MTSPNESSSPIQATVTDYKGQSMIRLEFPFDIQIINQVKQIDGRHWSRTLKAWFIPDTQTNRQRFDLNEFMGASEESFDKTDEHMDIILCQSLLEQVRNKIKLKGYSDQTLKSYNNHLKKFLKDISVHKNPLSVTKADIEQYLLNRQKLKSYSESDINSHINAIKFLYEQVLGHDRMLFYLPRPEKPLQLPKVLGEHELERMFRSVSNLKHKAILLTAFSCGLRVSEVTRLKVSDIDHERMQVLIERSKGKKDRYVTLSPVVQDILNQYIRIYKRKPGEYLFEGQEPGKPYSARSAQAIFNKAVKAAGIAKEVTFHALRHSYATHLLEKGVDIKYIKELLGHFDIKTTERYLHVAREKLVHIKSPLDYLDPGI
jgi:site-specific recombinase XerD